METSGGILVVDDDVETLRGLLELLRNAGYRAAGAADLDAALHLVQAISFDLLIADIRVKADNDLRLIRLARAEQPAMAVVALTGFPDPAVEAEVRRLGATYSLKPMESQRLLAIVGEKVSGPGKQRRWIRKHVAGGFRARIDGVPAKVLDMSYGGLRLEISMPPEKEPPPSIEVSLMSFGLSVSADVMWTTRLEPAGTWICGAALLETDPNTSRAWRGVVDTLPKPS
jgi:CheY-like chemotaxis protein